MQNLKPTAQKKLAKFQRRKIRINAKIKAQHPDFRVIINRSNRYVKAQLVDATGNVLGHVCDKELKGETKSLKAHEAGKEMAKIIHDKKISKVVFDRNGYLYHGRVHSFVEGMRAGGIVV